MLDAGATFQAVSPVVSISPESVATPSFFPEAPPPLATSEGRSVFSRAVADVFEAQRVAPKRRARQTAQLAALADALRLYPVAVPPHLPYCAPAALQWPSCGLRRASVYATTEHVLSRLPHLQRVQVENTLELLAKAGVHFSIEQQTP